MDPDRARELLERERGRIEKALADLAPEDSGEISDIDTHLGDEASDLYDDERDACPRTCASSSPRWSGPRSA